MKRRTMETLLSDYVDGLLTEEEASAVEALAASDPEVKRELRRVRAERARWALALTAAAPDQTFRTKVLGISVPAAPRYAWLRYAAAFAAGILTTLAVQLSLTEAVPPPGADAPELPSDGPEPGSSSFPDFPLRIR